MHRCREYRRRGTVIEDLLERPDCLKYMIKDTVYSFCVDKVIRRIIKTHGIIGGVKANSHALICYILSQNLSR